MRFLALVSLALMLPMASAANEAPSPPPNPAAILKSLPKSATSSDGLVKVFAADVAGDEIGFRAPILQFATGIVRELERALALPAMARRREPGMIIYAQDARTNDTRVVVRVVRRRSKVLTRIFLPSPGYSDLERLRLEVARAYLRVVIDAYVELPLKPGASGAAELPEWFVCGILRLANHELVRSDMRLMLKRWSSAGLAFFPTLCAGTELSREEALYLTAWLRERKLFADFFTSYARGTPWPASSLALHLTGKSDALAQDAANDRRMLKIMNKVLSPGVTAPEDLNIFASRLRLYPPYFELSHRFGCTFQEALKLYGDDPTLRREAARKAREVPIYALGRGEELQQAAILYMEFLWAVAGNEKPGRTSAALARADRQLEKARLTVFKDKEIER